MSLFRWRRQREPSKKRPAARALLNLDVLEDRTVPSTLWGNTLPTVGSANDHSPVELGVKIESDTDGYITGLRFYKGENNTGQQVGHLWTATGQLLGSVAFTDETATGWQQANFTTPIAISANTLYVASYFAPNGGYAADGGYFATSGVDSAPLHAPVSSSGAPNGLFMYGADSFPTWSYNSTNYWVDAVFNTAPVDPTPVTVVSQTPGPNATAVASDASVTAVFNKSVLPGSISFTLTDPNGNVAPASLSYDDSTHTATLTPNAPLTTQTTYTASLSGAQDSNGNTLAGPLTWSFTTVNSGPFSLWGPGSAPARPSVGDANAVELGVRFQSSVDGYITGVRFYKGDGNTGTHVGHLWTSDGHILATATFTDETAGSWQQVNFATPVAITAGTSYIASYYAPNGHYAADPGYFGVSGTDNGPLHAPASGVAGPNGLYAYGSDGFPTQTYGATNYWVDVVFSTSNRTGPTITDFTPLPNTSNAATTTPVTAVFSESVQPGSISFVLRDAANNVVPASLAYDDSTHQATLTPSAPLTSGTTYTATVSGAQGIAGDTMTAPVSWSFTASSGPFTVFGTAIPGVTMDYRLTEYPLSLGVKFRSDVPGVITGIRFLKGTGGWAPAHPVHLWSADGTLLATALSVNETTSGWQQATFAEPVAINPNTTYIASYYTNGSGYATTGNYFATSGADNGPLHALQDGADGPNGVYTSGSDTFPTQSTGGANFWVDVRFSTNPADDTAPLTVTDQTPEPGTTDVASGNPVTATFSEAVNPSTISFTLTDAAGNAVPGTVRYDPSSLTATLTPSAPLSALTTYTASVSASDALGVAMASPDTWSFTTAAGWQQTTAADFAAGTTDGTVVTSTAGGEVQLAPGATGGALGSPWASIQWQPGGGVLPVGSALSVAGAELYSTQTFAGVPIEASLDFAAAPYQHFGLATGLGSASGNSWALFSTMGTSDTLFARVNVNGATTNVSLGALPSGSHIYRVQPVPGAFQFYVDGVLQTTIAANLPLSTGMSVVASSYYASGSPLVVNWVHQGDGVFTSSVFDAGSSVTWATASWTATVPSGTSMIVQTRSGNSPTLDWTWSDWTAVTNGGVVASPPDRYIQYRVIFTTTTGGSAPTLDDITFNWS